MEEQLAFNQEMIQQWAIAVDLQDEQLLNKFGLEKFLQKFTFKVNIQFLKKADRLVTLLKEEQAKIKHQRWM